MNIFPHKHGFVSEGIHRAAVVTMTSVEKVFEAARHQRNYRKTVSALSILNDRELADIGVRREEIETVAKQSHP